LSDGGHQSRGGSFSVGIGQHEGLPEVAKHRPKHAGDLRKEGDNSRGKGEERERERD